MLNKYTPSKLHKYNPIVYTVEPVRTNLKQNKKVRNKDYIEVLIYLTLYYYIYVDISTLWKISLCFVPLS